MEADGRLTWRGIEAARVGEGVRGGKGGRVLLKTKYIEKCGHV